jgi:hypothetical protein
MKITGSHRAEIIRTIYTDIITTIKKIMAKIKDIKKMKSKTT